MPPWKAAMAGALLLSAGACGPPAPKVQTARPNEAVALTTPTPEASPPELLAARAEHMAHGCVRPENARLGEGYQQSADFNGDGRPDYVLDTLAFSCAGAEPPFCGSGGCNVDVILSTRTGYERPLNLRFHNAALVMNQGGRDVLRDGANGLVYLWNGTAFAPAPAQPAAGTRADNAAEAFVRRAITNSAPGEDFYDAALTALMADTTRLFPGDAVIDYDPICQCQDTRLDELTLASRPDGAGAYSVHVRARNGATVTEWTIAARLTAGHWGVTDVIESQGSLRERLSRMNACARARQAHRQDVYSCEED